MAQRVHLDLPRIEKYYRIEEDGAIWSYKLGRYLCPTRCGGTYSYFYVCIKDSGYTWVSVHKLVASKYLGVCPAGCEISHKDGNKWNNHRDNLEYITHSENLLKSFREHGRSKPVGNTKSPSWETKELMAAKKKKPVISETGEVWDSVGDCAKALNRSRVIVYRAMKYGRKTAGVRLRFLSDAK